MNQSETDLGIVNESQLLGFGISERAAELGLTYMDEDKEIFSRMGSTDAMLRSRYIQTGFTNWPTPEGLERTCLSLRVAVAKNLREKGLTIWL
jgi:hypothetical protein